MNAGDNYSLHSYFSKSDYGRKEEENFFVFIVLFILELTRLKGCLTLIRGAMATHVRVKGLNLKDAILNSQPLFTRCL